MVQSNNSTHIDVKELDVVDFGDRAYIESIRLQMVKFAQLQLSDQALAEDAVQEAFIGAMKNASSFAGRSAFKTWVFAILKNKIADTLRKRHRHEEVNNVDDDDSPFDQRGHWADVAVPTRWGDPEQARNTDEFWQIFEVCLNKLPEMQGKVFMMREYIGLTSEEICEAEVLSVSNLHVLLYRARLRLQRCLQVNWYGDAAHA